MGIQVSDADIQRVFGKVLAVLRPVGRERKQLLRTPETVLASMQRRVARMVDEGALDVCFEGALALVASIPPEVCSTLDARISAHLQQTARQIQRLAEGKELLRLIDSAHLGIRNGPLLATPEPEAHALALLLAQTRMAELRGKRGEIRARKLQDAVAQVSEGVYKPYLQAMWKLAELERGRVPQPPPAFGKLVEVLAERLQSYPTLIEPDAAHIRNAVAHRHAVYLPGEHAVELWDTSGWRRTLSIRNLEVLTRRMLRVAGEVYPKAFQHFLQVVVVRPAIGAIPPLARAIRAQDQVAAEQWAAELRRHQELLFSDLRASYAAQTVVAEASGQKCP